LGCAPDPAWGAYNALPGPLAGRGRGWAGEDEGKGRGRGGRGSGGEGKGGPPSYC